MAIVVLQVEILTLAELQTCALPFPYQLLCWNYYNCNLHLPITLELNECLMDDWPEDQQYHVGCAWNERNECHNKCLYCAGDSEIISGTKFTCR